MIDSTGVSYPAQFCGRRSMQSWGAPLSQARRLQLRSPGPGDSYRKEDHRSTHALNQTSKVQLNHNLCNNKLVGARTFTAGAGAHTEWLPGRNEVHDFQSPRDKDGHGTHVASTAAGSEVPGSKLFEFASGTAGGWLPRRGWPCTRRAGRWASAVCRASPRRSTPL